MTSTPPCFVDGPAGRRAALVGTGLDVWEVVAVVRDNDGERGRVGGLPGGPVGLVQSAVSYYAAHRDEIDFWLELDKREAEEAHAAWIAGQRAFGC